MKLLLTQHNFRLLRDGMTMIKYVNFTGSAMSEPMLQSTANFQALDEKLCASNIPSAKVPSDTLQELEITDAELDVFNTVIDSAIKRCGDGDTESGRINYRSHFSAEGREVLALLQALSSFKHLKADT